MENIIQNLHSTLWSTSTDKSSATMYNYIMEKIEALFDEQECNEAQSNDISYIPNAEFFRYEGLSPFTPAFNKFTEISTTEALLALHWNWSRR